MVEELSRHDIASALSTAQGGVHKRLLGTDEVVYFQASCRAVARYLLTYGISPWYLYAFLTRGSSLAKYDSKTKATWARWREGRFAISRSALLRGNYPDPDVICRWRVRSCGDEYVKHKARAIGLRGIGGMYTIRREAVAALVKPEVSKWIQSIPKPT